MKKSIIILSVLTSLLCASESDIYKSNDSCQVGLNNLKKYWSKRGIDVVTKIFDEGKVRKYQIVDAEIEFKIKEGGLRDLNYIFFSNERYKRRDFFVCKDGLLFTDVIPTSESEKQRLIGALLNTKAAKIAKSEIFKVNEGKNNNRYIIGTYDVMSNPLSANSFLLIKKSPIKLYLIPNVEEHFANRVKKMSIQKLKANALFILGFKKMDENTAKDFIKVFIKNPKIETIMSFFKEKNIKIDKNKYIDYINSSRKLGTFTSFLKNVSNPVEVHQNFYTTGIFEEF